MVKSTTSFGAGQSHPRYRTDQQLISLLETIVEAPLYLTGVVETRDRSRRYVEVACRICDLHRFVLADNLLSGKSRRCTCQGWKYDDKKRAGILGERYDAIVQRCETGTHVSSFNYKGRGIKVLFASREAFIRWALAKWKDQELIGRDIDRIDNDGHYEPSNLRLVTRSINLMNTRNRLRNRRLRMTTFD